MGRMAPQFLIYCLCLIRLTVAWHTAISPGLVIVRDIEALERVQRRFTRIRPICRRLLYKDRLKYYNLSSLYTHRLSFDLTMVFKIVHRYVDLDPSIFFAFCSDSRT